jgi:hypothetical protein
MLGCSYDDSPITAHEPGAQQHDPSMRTYEPTARPGARAPHAWLADGRSLYDLFGPGFTLLAFADAASSDLCRAKADAASLGIPLEIVHIDDERVAALYERRLALVRPDQHVAWRGDLWEGALLLRRATGQLDSIGHGQEATEKANAATDRADASGAR